MRTAGSIVAEVLAEMRNVVKPGITTWELDEIAYKIITKNKAIPTFKGYPGLPGFPAFPASICASVNQEVVHGIPSKDVVLKEGDIISIDVGATYKGMVGDSAITIGVGEISEDLKMLLETTNQALYDAIDKMRAGNHLQDVSAAIEDRALSKGLGIVKQYGGHGVGSSMHEDPFLFNYRTGDPGPLLKPGIAIAIEPMFNLGTGEVHMLSDGWTVVTNDGKPSAHFEHTVVVTDGEPEILTNPS